MKLFSRKQPMKQSKLFIVFLMFCFSILIGKEPAKTGQESFLLKPVKISSKTKNKIKEKKSKLQGELLSIHVQIMENSVRVRQDLCAIEKNCLASSRAILEGSSKESKKELAEKIEKAKVTLSKLKVIE